MAIAVMGEIPEEVYDAVNETMFGTKRPNEPIEGLVIHTVAKGPNALRIFDVWESREAFEDFTNGRVMPAMEEAGIEMEGGQEPEIIDLVHVVVNQEARV
jgi:heme-degrading monooxygenase HmoA